MKQSSRNESQRDKNISDPVDRKTAKGPHKLYCTEFGLVITV